MKYKVILKTTHKHQSRVQNCVDTWLKGVDYVCLTDKLTGNYPEFSGSSRDDYLSAEEKTINLLRAVKFTNEFDKYDWLVFIDDDGILNTTMFEYILPHLDKHVVYGLIMSGYPQKPELRFPSGGASYYISPSLIKRALPANLQNIGLEDVSVGHWIAEAAIEFRDWFLIGNNKYYLRLNGWYPFHDEEKQITNLTTIGEQYENAILSLIDGNKEAWLRLCMTHHYLRYRGFMERINKAFKEWTPADLSNYRL